MQKIKLDHLIKISDFDIKLNRETVFHIMDCHTDSPVFEEVALEYEKLEPEIYRLAKPEALIKFGKLKGIAGREQFPDEEPVVYVLLTIGDELSKLSSNYFAKGDYLAGMLANSMADDYLFQLDFKVQEAIREECADRQLGVKQRLEAPGMLPMEAQQIILQETNASEELQIGLTVGYMFTIVKTNAYILLLTGDQKESNLQHNCAECGAVNCKLRKKTKVTIEVLKKDKRILLECNMGESLLEAMLRQKIYVSAVCGGKGTCGKCGIQVFEGKLDITEQDKLKFTSDELARGYRLSCRAYPKEDCKIKLITGDESDFEVVTDYQEQNFEDMDPSSDSYVIGIDIGTTTIAMNLAESKKSKIIRTYTTVNKQRAYGADVISRIKASNEGKQEILKESIRKDLLDGIRILLEDTKISKDKITEIAIAGNTTMGHLLLGYSCKTLGVSPYTPVNISTIRQPFKEIFSSDYLEATVTLLPGISTFVGGDIVAGLLVCGFHAAEKPSMLIDLGTNGEMAVGNKDKILVSSTAAGPAFEGGNISCGVGSISGAICNVTLKDRKAEYRTIGDQPPVGICGTGVIEITSELLKNGFMDETGLLNEDYFESGFKLSEGEDKILFTQKDVREIQLAKAAVRAGIEILLQRYGLTYDGIDTVYLAGGFGYKVNVDKAIHIGLLPEEFKGKIIAVGNSSLAGAMQYLSDEAAAEKIGQILSVSGEISLSNDKAFNDLYIDYINFEKA